MVSSIGPIGANMTSLTSALAALSGGRRTGATSSALRAMADRMEAIGRQQAAEASNSLNAMAYLATSDSWIQNINGIMGRMGELAVAASDGTKSAVDRMSLQFEFAQMQQAIQSITTGPDAMARFNGIPLFQGGTVSFGDSFSYSAPDLTSASATVISESGDSQLTWGDVLSKLEITTLESAQKSVGAIHAGTDYLSGIKANAGAAVGSLAVASATASAAANAATFLDNIQYNMFINLGMASVTGAAGRLALLA